MKLISGCLAMVSFLSTVFSPAVAYAEVPTDEKIPYYEEVKDQLDPDEVVTAKDIDITIGSSYDIVSDFSGIEIPDDSKVKVTFHDAQNEKGDPFTTDHEDTYQAAYYLEPLMTGHPAYQISRNISVKDAETEAKSKVNSDGSSEEDSGDGGSETSDSEEDSSISVSEETERTEEQDMPDKEEMLSEEAFDKALESAEGQKTVDDETGMTLGEALLQAEEQGINLQEMERGESISFTAQAPVAKAARASQSVTITQGSYYYYADYGLGSYVTAPFTVSFGNVTATAYCIQPSKPGPGSGTYQITKLEGNRELAKVCYYGTEASGSAYFFNHYHTDFSAGKRFIVTHLAASYANGSSDAFYGTNSTGESLAMDLRSLRQQLMVVNHHLM